PGIENGHHHPNQGRDKQVPFQALKPLAGYTILHHASLLSGVSSASATDHSPRGHSVIGKMAASTEEAINHCSVSRRRSPALGRTPDAKDGNLPWTISSCLFRGRARVRQAFSPDALPSPVRLECLTYPSTSHACRCFCAVNRRKVNCRGSARPARAPGPS